MLKAVLNEAWKLAPFRVAVVHLPYKVDLVLLSPIILKYIYHQFGIFQFVEERMVQ